MIYQRTDFVSLPLDSDRVVTNLEGAYEQWLDARRHLARLPVSMYWKKVGAADYLGVKVNSRSAGTTGGARSPSTEAEYLRFKSEKAELKARVARANVLIDQRAGQYRNLKLPVLGDRLGQLLRALDIDGVLLGDVLVMGANTLCVYELLCGARFPIEHEPTEELDLAWCLGRNVHSASPVGGGQRAPLLQVLQSVDRSYKINAANHCQAVNADGNALQLLAVCDRALLSEDDAFIPMYSGIEQEWLLKGSLVAFVVATSRRRACPVVAPDPRRMALYMLWQSSRPERSVSQRQKDRRLGVVILDACHHFLSNTYPLDIQFVLDLPVDLRASFGDWASERHFVPSN